MIIILIKNLDAKIIGKKKLLGILVLGLLRCGTANAEDYTICDWVVTDAYADHLNNYSNEEEEEYQTRKPC